MPESPSSYPPAELRLNGLRLRASRRELLLVALLLGTGGGAWALRPQLLRAMGVADIESFDALAARMRTSEDTRAVYVPRFELVERVVAEQGRAVEQLTVTTGELRDSFYEDRAERLADRAADRVHDARRSRETWQRVRERALRNQRERRPIRDGLDGALD